MVLDRGIEFEDSANKHGYTLDDVLYAAKHPIEHSMYEENGRTYVKFIGRNHGDVLVPYIEVMMWIEKSGRMHVFHVNALQGGFIEQKGMLMDDFVWDDNRAKHYDGKESEQMIQAMFMRAADDAPDIDTAVRLLKAGRPRVEEKREQTVAINARFPQSWTDWIDEQAKKLGINRSQVIRDTFYRGMQRI